MPDRIHSLYRARLAREKGTIRKEWGGRTSVALVYPNVYHVGMSNLGFQVVYRLLNRRQDCVAERVFLPDPDEASLRGQGGRGLLSMESLSPLSRFELVAFSLSFENDYPHVLKILDMARLPLLAGQRGDTYPLVMAGGIAAFLNPEPLTPFLDLFLLGEGEVVLDEFLSLFQTMKAARAEKGEVLKAIALGLKSAYVPSLYHVDYGDDGRIKSLEPSDARLPEKVEAARDISPGREVASSVILTPETEFADKVLVEVGRGCGCSCRFCAAGYVYRPPRVHGEAELLRTVERVIEEGRQIGLLSASIPMSPGMERIAGHIVERGGSFSVSSLRADALSESFLERLKEAGQGTVAIAPEAGSERLRKVVNKHLTREQIIHAVQLIARSGGFFLRLYFLIGLPTETMEDVEAILELVKAVKHHTLKESVTRGRIGGIRLSVNCFVPKASTPFQWFPMNEIFALKEKQKWLRKALGKEGGVKVSFDLPKWAYVQTLLSMGDRRVGKILLAVHQHGGDWDKALRYSEINPDFFVYRPKGLDETLPWDFIDHGIRKSHLVREYELALKEEESDMCRVGECLRCGVCRSEGG